MDFYDIEGNVVKCENLKEVSFRPGIYVAVINSDNKVLMIVDEKTGKWEFPGGGLEIGEELIDAGVREVLEETGYEIEIDSEEEPHYIDKELTYYSNRSFKHSINFYYVVRVSSDLVQGEQKFDEGENILKVEFVDIFDLKENDVAFFQRKGFARILEHLKD